MERRVARQLPVQLGVEEIAVLDQLEGHPAGRGLRLGALRSDGGLAVRSQPEVEVLIRAQDVGASGGRDGEDQEHAESLL